MESEMLSVNIDLIKPYPKNSKRHTPAQILEIADSIKEFGFNQPIVVDKENIIIVGHGRYEAAKILNLKKIPVIKVDLTEEQAKTYRIKDNKSNESQWETSTLVEELKSLGEKMRNFTGFDENFMDKIEAKFEKSEIPIVPFYKVHFLLSAKMEDVDIVLKKIEELKAELPSLEIEQSGN